MKRPRNAPHVTLLKSPRYSAFAGQLGGLPASGALPYAIDVLSEAGLDLDFTDADYRLCDRFPRLGRLARTAERRVCPFLQTTLSLHNIVRSDAVLAMFESEASALNLLRLTRAPGVSRPTFAVIVCWLAEVLLRASPRRRRLYRELYRGVDRLIYFSSNQGRIFERELGLPPERLHFVHFGVDHVFFQPQILDVPVSTQVLAVGRDRGRDWPTLLEAIRGTELQLTLICRPGELDGLWIPPNVDVQAPVSRSVYRDRLGRASVVVVPSRPRAYPTGQSVALEAMAMARCCVVTATESMADYLNPDVNALTVPPGDAAALRGALERAVADPRLRADIGRGGRRCVEEHFNARAMWARIGQLLRELVVGRHP